MDGDETPLSACPHCGGRPQFEMVPEGDPGGFGGRSYVTCTNVRCGACTGLAPAGLDLAHTEDFLRRIWNARTDPNATARTSPPKFPTALRKMWSGEEVQSWIDANWVAP